ncbi:MAG: hypothetical protein P8048_04480, partial [Calditrichia bacterium]
MRYLSIFLVVLLFAGCTDHKKLADLQEKQAQLETEYRLMIGTTVLRDNFIEQVDHQSRILQSLCRAKQIDLRQYTVH